MGFDRLLDRLWNAEQLWNGCGMIKQKMWNLWYDMVRCGKIMGKQKLAGWVWEIFKLWNRL